MLHELHKTTKISNRKTKATHNSEFHSQSREGINRKLITSIIW